MILSSLVTLWTVLVLSNQDHALIYEALACLFLIRVAYYLTRGSRPVLTPYYIRKKLSQVFQEEARVTIAFVATGYILSWSLDRNAMAVFVLANILAQSSHFYLTRLIRNRLTHQQKSKQDEECGKKVIIVGTGAKAKAAADMILRSPELDTNLIGFLDYHRRGLWRYADIPLIGHPDTLTNLISHRQVDALIIAVEPEDMAHTSLLFSVAEQMGVTVCLLPNVFEAEFATAKPGYINGDTVVVYRAIPEGQFAHAAKLVMDKLGALVGLILASPLMLVTAIAIKLESKGPVFFRQVRSGLNGKPFNLYKFRTMRGDAELLKDQLQSKNEMSGPAFKIKNDPRVTRLGRLLRKFSIDEIPQFINVLKGEMSLVGPRPPLPKEVVQYKPWQHRKLSVRPGVTCTWQVSGRNNIDFEDWMRLDLEYIDNWSLWQDTKIIAKTLPAVMKSRGAS